MAFSIVLIAFGIGALCGQLYSFAVYMLPAYVGLSVGFWSIGRGTGVLGGIILGIAAGTIIFVLGQVTLSNSRSHWLRWSVLLIFVVPAIYAGYSIVQQVWSITMPLTFWRYVFGVIGALASGWTTFARLCSPVGTNPANAM